MKGQVLAVCTSEKTGTRKANVGEALVRVNWGIEGDAHAGEWHRQISLLAIESIDKMRAKGLDVGPGDFAENITTEGLDLVSLPVGTRSGISALRQIHPSIEESAYDLGAGSGKVFMSVTLPLIKDSFFSGLVTTFVRSITAISAIILLVTPRYLLITTRINEFAEKGSYGIACAYATILILIVYASILLMNLFIKYFGTSKQIREAENVQ